MWCTGAPGVSQKRLAAKHKENKSKRDMGGADLNEGDLVWVNQFEKLDRGILRKKMEWTICIRKKISPSSWEIILPRGRVRQVHVDNIQKMY